MRVCVLTISTLFGIGVAIAAETGLERGAVLPPDGEELKNAEVLLEFLSFADRRGVT